MTRHNDQQQPQDPTPEYDAQDVIDVPLDSWMLDCVREAQAELDAGVEVPREMMWARIQRERTQGAETQAPARLAEVTPLHGAAVGTRGPARWWRQVAAAAAVLVSGVAIGRYVVPSPTSAPSMVAAADSASSAFSADPSHVAMQEHLVRTVTLLTTVRDEARVPNAGTELAPLARELLSTTRLLLDQPQLRDERTRRLLQDLELVLVQVIQARSTAPETQRAPRETLRETNLLTRVNALVTAASQTDAAIYGGD
ncbi:hypothetical protein [Gemmatimonas sp.]